MQVNLAHVPQGKETTNGIQNHVPTAEDLRDSKEALAQTLEHIIYSSQGPPTTGLRTSTRSQSPQSWRKVRAHAGACTSTPALRRAFLALAHLVMSIFLLITTETAGGKGMCACTGMQ